MLSSSSFSVFQRNESFQLHREPEEDGIPLSEVVISSPPSSQSTERQQYPHLLQRSRMPFINHHRFPSLLWDKAILRKFNADLATLHQAHSGQERSEALGKLIESYTPRP